MAPAFGLGHRWAAEKLDHSALNRECNPAVDDPTELLVIGQSLLDLPQASRANESADWPSPVHIGQFVIGTVSLRSVGMHAAASRVSADVVLLGDASRMEGAQGKQPATEGFDLSFQTTDR